jgi:nitrogen regulatory protein PII-like uncharacterized protein
MDERLLRWPKALIEMIAIIVSRLAEKSDSAMAVMSGFTGFFSMKARGMEHTIWKNK